MRFDTRLVLVVALSGVAIAVYAAEGDQDGGIHPAFRNFPPFPRS